MSSAPLDQDRAPLDQAQLRFFAELRARGVPCFVTGRSALVLQDLGTALPGAPVDLDAHPDFASVVRAAADASGCDIRDRWPPSPSRRAIVRYPGRDEVARDLEHTKDVVVDGIAIRVLTPERMVSNERRDRRDGAGSLEGQLRAHGIVIPMPRKVPAVELGWVHGGAALLAIEKVLEHAGYELSADGRARSYAMDHDTDPRTGASSARVAIHEDPERPIVDEVRRALRTPR